MLPNTSTMPIMATNHSLFDATLPPLPSYTLTPKEDLISWFPDTWGPLFGPIIVYWITSAIFHIIDVWDLFPQYRLHTPEEITSRNHVGRWDCFRDVLVQQVVQIVTGYVLTLTEEAEMVGKEEYDVAVWATRLRLAQRFLPTILAFIGLNAADLSKSMSTSHPLIAGALAGGHYPFLDTAAATPSFASWEIFVAKAIYHVIVPAIQFFIGACFIDFWQYCLHRGMHMNKWLYTNIHSRHHRLYVPYAYGALYNHPIEGFLLDTLGAGLAFKVTGMTILQGTAFFCFSSIKTVDDHCGYDFPWDPLQLISSNNAAYHDIHHQHWGIKTNFSQPFFTFWDGFLGTKYTGNRTNRLEDKKRIEAEKAKKQRAI
jgi:sphinganine C4-monooxygenase